MKKWTIGNLPAVCLIGFSLLLDLLKIFILFLSALSELTLVIPIVGEVIGALGAAVGIFGPWFISLLEFVFINGTLFLCGAYSGKAGVMNALIAGGEGVVDLVPVLDDLPATTAGTVAIIVRSRMNDMKEHALQKARAATAAKQRQEQMLRAQAAQEAAIRADAMRAQAMAASIAAANDNAISVANDNEDEQALRAA